MNIGHCHVPEGFEKFVSGVLFVSSSLPCVVFLSSIVYNFCTGRNESILLPGTGVFSNVRTCELNSKKVSLESKNFKGLFKSVDDVGNI